MDLNHLAKELPIGVSMTIDSDGDIEFFVDVWDQSFRVSRASAKPALGFIRSLIAVQQGMYTGDEEIEFVALPEGDA